MSHSNDTFAVAVGRLERIGASAGVDTEVLEDLRRPTATLTAALRVRMDDGSTRYFPAYRCRYDDTLGPSKGGIRFHPEVCLEEVQALALWMTLKCSLAGLPFGGGKGGVAVDPKALSHLELERLARAYMRAMADFVGPDTDIPAPDVYTDARIMGWMLDEYEAIHRCKAPGVITGKPLALGGIPGRDEATGRGAWVVALAALGKLGTDPRAVTVAVQGFGNAGYHVARLLASSGCRVVAVSDSKGGVFAPDGLDVEALHRTKLERHDVTSFYPSCSVCEACECAEGMRAPGCEDRDCHRISNEELLELEVDVLVPAALESVIGPWNASRVRARVVAEVANGPILPEADAILAERGVLVLPDILTNAGGVIASYFEWAQNRGGVAWHLDAVRERLAARIEAAFERVWQRSRDIGVTARDAAYILAVERLSEAIGAQGNRDYFRPSR